MTCHICKKGKGVICDPEEAALRCELCGACQAEREKEKSKDVTL